MQELQDALGRARDTSAGPNELHQHLPKFSLLLIKSGYLVTLLLIGGKKLSFLCQSLVKIKQILPVIVLLR